MATPRKDPANYLPRGRPSKYNKSMCNTVVECMNKGYIVEEVCVELGIHRDTFNEWVKTYPDFSDSYKKGKAAFIAFWARAYKKVMMGIPFATPKKPEAKKPEAKEKKTTSKKDKEKEEAALALGKANPAMMIFYMKAHCGWSETIVNENNVKFTENLSFITMTPEERDKRIEELLSKSEPKKPTKTP